MRRGARAVKQFYPETAEHAILISECVARVGFAGVIVVDYPNSTKAKKHYLVLSFKRAYRAPPGLTGADVEEGALVKNGSGGRSGTGVRVADVDPKKAGGGKRGDRVPRKKKGLGRRRNGYCTRRTRSGRRGRTQGRTQSTRGGRGLLDFRMPVTILECLI